MKVRATTKRAFQAATAILIAEAISFHFQLERGYWVTLTAMALTMQTWGESLMRSFERVSMTILGGLVGTALYFIVPNDPVFLVCCLLFFVFLTVYMRQIVYLVSVFFLTCFVVFLFALISHWTLSILFDRILETILGAVIALVVSRFFLPAQTDVADLFVDFFGKVNASIRLTFEAKACREFSIPTQYLAFENQKLRKSALTIRYELLFHRMSKQDFNALLAQTTLCTQTVIYLMDAYLWYAPYLNQPDQDEIAMAVKTTHYNMEALMRQLKHKKHTAILPVARVSERLSLLIKEDPAHFASLDSEALGFFSLMYFFAQLNKCLTEMHTIINKAAI